MELYLYKSSEPQSYEATWIGFSLFRNCLFLVAYLWSVRQKAKS